MKKILIPVSTLFVAGFAQAQSLTSSENYVYSKTYLTDPTGSNVKTAETVQYFDGLGRPKQVVNVKASPGSKDVVTHIEYDGFGRQIKDYLPVPQNNTGNGAIVPSPLSNATNTPYGTEKIYAEKTLENSPLDRVLSQKQLGEAWNDKPVTFGYDANIDGEVKKYVATFDYETFMSSIVLSSTGYGANQLYKNSVTDEDGNKTIEFKNGEGQVVLVRKMLDATMEADTYYVYNDYNQLAYVIPPLAVVANNVDEQTTLKNLCYQYKYDNRNRLVEKKLPGKGWEYMVYDKQDRLVGTKDSVNPWLVTKYDQFGRVAYTGTYTSGGSRSSVQAEIEGASNSANNEARASSSFNNSGMDVYYTNTAFPASITKVLSVNYYDTYPTGTPAAPTTQTVLSDDAQNNAVSTKSLPVASYIKNIEDDNWTKNYTWYDAKGRSIATHSINHLGGYTKTEMDLDFSGTVQQSITRHKRLNTDVERTITENFTYDHQNRLLTHVHQVDNLTPEFLAQNTYNELSQLVSKKIGGVSQNTPLQTADYAYNIRGWLTKVNDPSNLGAQDFFGYEIKYNNPENTGNSTGRYNGNIAEATWKTAVDYKKRRYNYQYDGLNRLLTGVYSEPDDITPVNNYYNETLTYDLNGNILSLVRNTKDVAGATPMDNLSYNYTGNRLNSVTDSSMNYSGYPDTSGNIISYDTNGNMLKQEDKGILEIRYNHLNLPNYNRFNQSAIRTDIGGNNMIVYKNTNYLYRADGVKLKKIHQYFTGRNNGSDVFKTTEYLDGFQYEIESSGGRPGAPIPKFVPTAEGYYNFENNKYIYNYTDHLGNVRLSYFKNDNNSAEVLEENNYYPFGLKHEGYNATAGNPSYQYKYNGKELQETGMYDYGA
ncbi:DUF6443 domain-containing protein, partial [Chryseobacterium sp.]|uniref:DUF6443 domain-containing protein n=1 Tax=Chryseobacterium sp. TaxID=1871047 RepID=UPI0028995EBC